MRAAYSLSTRPHSPAGVVRTACRSAQDVQCARRRNPNSFVPDFDLPLQEKSGRAPRDLLPHCTAHRCQTHIRMRAEPRLDSRGFRPSASHFHGISACFTCLLQLAQLRRGRSESMVKGHAGRRIRRSDRSHAHRLPCCCVEYPHIHGRWQTEMGRSGWLRYFAMTGTPIPFGGAAAGLRARYDADPESVDIAHRSGVT